MPFHLILFFATICYLTSVSASESILKYDSEITINPDATMLVIETITVKAEGIKIKHGVYRDLPTDYKDQSGHRYKIGFKVIEILRDGIPEPYHIKKQNNGVRIFFGDKDRYLEPGTYTYSLRYEVNRQLGLFSDHDALYWSVTGNKWIFPIKEATATIHLPQSIPDNSITLESYTGKTGQQGTNNATCILNNHNAVFKSTTPLNPGAGLAILITWPKNYITEPDSTTRLHYFLDENPESPIAVAGILIIFSYYVFAFFRVSKAPKKCAIIPSYQVPTGFSPASLRYIQGKKYDFKTFTATLINLAVKGHLHIEEGTFGKFVLNKKNSSASLASGEKTILNHLFASDSHFIELKRSNYKQIQKALVAHKKSLKMNIEKIYFLNNSTYLIPGILLSIIILATLIIIVPVGDKTAGSLFFPLWLAIWTIVVFSLILTTYKAWQSFLLQHSFTQLAPAIFTTLLALAFVFGEIFGLKLLVLESSMTVAVSLPLLVLINFCFYRRLKPATLSGRKLLNKLDGFKLYLEAAANDHTQQIKAPGKTTELFEQLLPYAFALDVEQQWSKKFASTLELTTLSSEYKPRWLNSSHPHHNTLDSFASTIGNSITSALISSSKAPDSH